jgi:branched-chain amino acid transport system ATP-binding protein
VLEVRDLGVRYDTTEAVAGVDLDVGDGEVVALLGANGAGKTSILRAISRLVAGTGTIRFDGREITGDLPSAVARAGLIHVPEGRHVFGPLTVEENLLTGMTAASGRTPAYGLAEVYDLFPALAPLRHRAGSALSGGEQQMVAIGRALVGAPRLLLLDEPSLGLAPVVIQAVEGALREIARQTPLLLVEQNTTLALDLADRVYMLAVGRVVLTGTADEVNDREALLSSYLGQQDARSA